MTLQQAKNEVAKRHGFKSWADIDFYQFDSGRSCTEPPYGEDVLADEAAELYCMEEKKRLEKENAELKRQLQFYQDKNVNQ